MPPSGEESHDAREQHNKALCREPPRCYPSCAVNKNSLVVSDNMQRSDITNVYGDNFIYGQLLIL